MANSMTGFGRSTKIVANTSIIVEVKTVNHRFVEYYFRMPRFLTKLEDPFRKMIAKSISRGRVEIFVNVEGDGLTKRKLRVDYGLVEQYLAYIKELKENYHLKDDLTANELLAREEVIRVEEIDSEDAELEQQIMITLQEAVLACLQMRQQEGKTLAAKIFSYIAEIRDTLTQLEDYAPNVAAHYANRLTARIEGMVGKEFDEARLVQEIAILADKADITEELVRLASHIEQFEQTLTQIEPIGRRLDFLIQEMNREVNTIGSKANDAKIASKVVDLKSNLEKMKEQIQNIE